MIVQYILDDRLGVGSSSGVFFLSPRNEGRVAFIKHDLWPAIEMMGAMVIYVDLQADPSADPGSVIREAIMRAAGFQRWATVQTLIDLSNEVKKPIVMIIDEVQHALSSEDGRNALWALKACRDQLNSSGHYGLRIMAISPDQDALTMLTYNKRAAFFCAPIIVVDI
ncbi:MAG: hypothetical protein B7X44_06515 [Halothiobacillus sp. 15-55-196]|jgi:hypothetical protein|nr:MAG: hypothetical protein B7X44_06515 [Halothiobacillus sp. 15-55-196]